MITSTSNAHIKALRQLLNAKERQVTGLFLAEGLRVVGQAFDSGAELHELIVAPHQLVSDYGRGLLHRAVEAGIPVTEVDDLVLESLARKDKPQGLLAVIGQQWRSLEHFSPRESCILIALESVQNPGNLGTILRTCDAVGAQGLILLDDSTDPYDPQAVKSSMGSVFTVPLFRADLPRLQAFATHQPGLVLLGSSDKASEDCFRADYPAQCLLLMGSERQGLSAEYQALCQRILRIPMEGACDSLNLSVASSILLYQAYIRHQQSEVL